MRNARSIAAAIAVFGLVGAAIADGRTSVAPRAFDRTVICEDDDAVVTVGSGPRTSNGEGAVSADDRGSLSAPGGTPDLANLPFAAASTQGGAYVNTKRCKRTKIRVPLTKKGLPNFPTLFSTTARCPVGQRLLLRLRYTYLPVGPPPASYAVGGRLVSAFLAVRTYPTRKPLAFARLTASGDKAQLYTAAACTT